MTNVYYTECPKCESELWDKSYVPGDMCPECQTELPTINWEEDAAYERLANRDRLDGFERTGGKDWT